MTTKANAERIFALKQMLDVHRELVHYFKTIKVTYPRRKEDLDARQAKLDKERAQLERDFEIADATIEEQTGKQEAVMREIEQLSRSPVRVRTKKVRRPETAEEKLAKLKSKLADLTAQIAADEAEEERKAAEPKKRPTRRSKRRK